MIVVNLIMGLVIVGSVIAILYGIGLFILKRCREYDEETHFIEIMVYGLIGLMVIVIGVTLLSLIYTLGELVVVKLEIALKV
jgi:hypothetical protein